MCQFRRFIGTHTLKINCVCTDEIVSCVARKLLKIRDTESFPRVCYISTTTLDSVSSRTHPHTHGRAGIGKVRLCFTVECGWALFQIRIYVCSCKFMIGGWLMGEQW